MDTKKKIYIALTTLLGTTFIISAITKLFPIQFFELSLIDYNIASWETAQFLARFIIAYELFLGSLLLINILHNRKILLITIFTLLLFSAHLLFILITRGNQENCMCFGNSFQLSSLHSLYKNCILLILSIILYIKKYSITWKHKNWVTGSILIVTFAVPYALFPITIQSDSIYMEEDTVNFGMHFEKLYTNPKIEKPTVDLTKGKHIVIFATLTCKYCKIAAYKFSIIKHRYPNTPIYMFLYGDSKNEKEFFKITQSKQIPHTYLDMNNFYSRAGIRLPAIYLLENGKIIQKIRYTQIEPKDILLWIQ